MFHICSIHFLNLILLLSHSKDSCPFLSQKLNLYFSFLFGCSTAFDTVGHSSSWNIPSSNIWGGYSSGFTFGIIHPFFSPSCCSYCSLSCLAFSSPEPTHMVITRIPRVPDFITQISSTLEIHIANQMLSRIWKLNRLQIKITLSSPNRGPPCSPMSVTRPILHPVSQIKILDHIDSSLPSNMCSWLISRLSQYLLSDLSFVQSHASITAQSTTILHLFKGPPCRLWTSYNPSEDQGVFFNSYSPIFSP